MNFKSTLSLFLFITSLHASASDFILEASGVTKVAGTVVIAGDEDSNALWLLRGEVKAIKTKVKGKWDDMEGLATLDENRFFGITSQSLTKKGKSRPEREQLILFSLEPKITIQKEFSPRNQILTALENELGSELDMAKVRGGTPDNGGLNVEGLAYDSGKLYLGLRSPLTKSGEAIILEMSDGENDPQVTRIIRAKLDGRGIRSLDAEEGHLIILSGSSTDESESFGLYQLKLSSQEVSRIPQKGFEILLRPEGVISETSRNFLFVQDFETEEAQSVIVRLPRELPGNE